MLINKLVARLKEKLYMVEYKIGQVCLSSAASNMVVAQFGKKLIDFHTDNDLLINQRVALISGGRYDLLIDHHSEEILGWRIAEKKSKISKL